VSRVDQRWSTVAAQKMTQFFQLLMVLILLCLGLLICHPPTLAHKPPLLSLASPPHLLRHHTCFATTLASPPHLFRHHTCFATTLASPPHLLRHHTCFATTLASPPHLLRHHTCAPRSHAVTQRNDAHWTKARTGAQGWRVRKPTSVYNLDFACVGTHSSSTSRTHITSHHIPTQALCSTHSCIFCARRDVTLPSKRVILHTPAYPLGRL
jgi:hypothetical protein